MRVYQIARELEKPHRGMLQLLRELGYEVPSHMAPLAEDQEQQLREAVERQERGAPTVRAVHTTAPSVSAAKVAEVVGEVELSEDTEWDGKRPAAAAPAATPARPGPATPGRPPVQRKRKEVARGRGIDRDELADQLSREAELEGLEMVTEAGEEVDFIGPPLPPDGLVAETGVRTVDLAALEDPKPVAPVPSTMRPERPRRQRGPRQRIRTLTRRRRTGPKVSIQATQQLTVTVPTTMKDLSQVFGVRAQDMIKSMMHATGEFGFSMNTMLEADQVEFLADEFERNVTITTAKAAEDQLEEKLLAASDELEGDASHRPPVVAILGHVDHGKTSLLDKIRDANVVDSEHGGITQHIGAFQVETKSGQRVTFLDTPGHAAFTAMRARGAQAADIVVLVVAADDGVMPQTQEAIQHSQLAKVPIVVAVNKIDKNNANPTKVKQELTAYGLTPEEWGGETVCCDVSAITGEGVDALVEALALQAEMEELTAHSDAPARGRVIEGRKDPARGVICTLLVEEGTLNSGDTVIAGMGMGRVRRMQDHLGKQVKTAPPSTPVEIFGINEVPEAGDSFHVVKDMTLAKRAVDERKHRIRQSAVKDRPQVTLDSLFAGGGAEAPNELRIILKADVRGSVEPLKTEFAKLEHPEVKLNLLYAGLGAITQSDVDNAITANAVIVGFHVLAEPTAKRGAERKGVEIRRYTVIYEIIDDIKAAMEGLLAPEKREEVTGQAEVRQIFTASTLGRLAGSYVTSGFIRRDDYIRIYRGGKLMYGLDRAVQVDSMRRFKDDVKEVREGFECGLRVAGYQGVEEGDVIEFYALKEVKRSLDDKGPRKG